MTGLSSYRFWAYAATFGALWGAMEITVGSFLHALRVPLSGVVLAGVGASLLVSMRSILPSRGLVLAAGLVCAGLKLLSPAGAIVGPTVAILVEAALVEIVLAPLGANLGSAAVAGAAVSLWSIAQKLVTQTIFYGLPVVGLYQGVLSQAEELLRLPPHDGVLAATLAVGAICLVGAAIAATGAFVGSAARRQLRGASA